MSDFGAILGYIVGVVGLVTSISTFVYTRTRDAKKDGKECAVDSTTVIVKLENLQNTMNRMIESMSSMQTKFENFDHRLTVVETKLAAGMYDGKSLSI